MQHNSMITDVAQETAFIREPPKTAQSRSAARAERMEWTGAVARTVYVKSLVQSGGSQIQLSIFIVAQPFSRTDS
jgi:hypothetical protein